MACPTIAERIAAGAPIFAASCDHCGGLICMVCRRCCPLQSLRGHPVLECADCIHARTGVRPTDLDATPARPLFALRPLFRVLFSC